MSSKSNQNIPLKQIYFKGPHYRQNYSLPDSIVYYITKKPSNMKFYQKQIQTCKSFFSKNPIIVIKELSYTTEKQWEIITNEFHTSIDFPQISYKLWISDKIQISDNKNQKAFSTIFKYFYKINATETFFHNQIISYKQFLFLSSNFKTGHFRFSNIVNEDGKIVSIEKLIQVLPKIKDVSFTCFGASPKLSNITTKTVEDLLKLSHFFKIEKFKLLHIAEQFDIKTFFIFLKKNKTTKFRLYFSPYISVAYKVLLETIVDEILECENRDYQVPFIQFEDLDLEKRFKLLLL